jgi:hypothetical protein
LYRTVSSKFGILNPKGKKRKEKQTNKQIKQHYSRKTMVEVTLTPPRSRRRSTKSKICWIPFKKQILDNRSRSLPTTKYAFASAGIGIGSSSSGIIFSPQHHDAQENENQEIIHNKWDLDNDYILSSKLSRTNSRSRSINRRSKSSRGRRRGGQPGSVSTGTGTDTSFLSEESRTTAGTGTSSLTTYNSSSHISSSQYSRSTAGTKSKSQPQNCSYQTNSTVQKSFLDYDPTKKTSLSRSSPPPTTRSSPSSSPNSRIINDINNNINDISSLADGGDDDLNDNNNYHNNGNTNHHHRPDESANNQKIGEDKQIPMVKKLAMVETNCISKEFWTDEVVEGGSFTCLQQNRRQQQNGPQKKCIQLLPERKEVIKVVKGSSSPQAVVNTSKRRSVTFNDSTTGGGDDGNESGGGGDTMTNKQKQQQQQHQHVTNNPSSTSQQQQQNQQQKNDVVHPFGKIMQYVSQDPDDDANSRRFICSSIPFRNNMNRGKNNRTTLPRGGGEEKKQSSENSIETANCDYNGRRSNSSNSSKVTKGKGAVDEGDGGTNFYVEVEALREQLDGIRDLDDIRAEDNKIMEEEMEVARTTASLADEDSAFMKDSVQGENSETMNNSTTTTIKDNTPLLRSLLLKQPASSSSKRNNISTSKNRSNSNNKHVGFIGDLGISSRKQRDNDNKSNNLLDRQLVGPVNSLHSNSSKRPIKNNGSVTKNGGSISATWSDRYNEDFEQKRNASSAPSSVPHKIDNRYIVSSSIQSNYNNNNNVRSGRDLLPAERGREMMDRQDKLISEMVTDRVLGMRIENGIISDSMPIIPVCNEEEYRGKGSNISRRKQQLQESCGRLETSPTGDVNGSFSKSHSSKKNHSSIIIDPSSSSSVNPLNISDMTELSHDHFEVDRNNEIIYKEVQKRQKSIRGSSSGGNMTHHNDDDRQDDWQESAIGYYRRANSTSHQKNDKVEVPISPPQRNRRTNNKGSSSDVGPSTSGNFDDNFWKEESDDLNTEAFETYDSDENDDSVFGDILSTPDAGISSKNSLDGSKQSDGQLSQAELSRYTNKSRYSRAEDSSRYSRSNTDSKARTTYLQGDDFVCADQWS